MANASAQEGPTADALVALHGTTARRLRIRHTDGTAPDSRLTARSPSTRFPLDYSLLPSAMSGLGFVRAQTQTSSPLAISKSSMADRGSNLTLAPGTSTLTASYFA